MKRALMAALASIDIAITRRSSLDELRNQYSDSERALQELRDRYLVLSQPEHYRQRLVELIPKSRSQIRQDLFALAQCGFKTGGFFVEFGACDGGEGSNTLLLEREFGWNGILAEPAQVWHRALHASRRAHISTKCIWSQSGDTVTFNEAPSPALSTIESFSRLDGWASRRANGRAYVVETISLNDLLASADAPTEMDYLSIDTEGSELQILEALDFSAYRFSVITCEHNFTPNREAIHQLLSRHGYIRRLSEISQFDDWYVLAAAN